MKHSFLLFLISFLSLEEICWNAKRVFVQIDLINENQAPASLFEYNIKFRDFD